MLSQLEKTTLAQVEEIALLRQQVEVQERDIRDLHQTMALKDRVIQDLKSKLKNYDWKMLDPRE